VPSNPGLPSIRPTLFNFTAARLTATAHFSPPTCAAQARIAADCSALKLRSHPTGRTSPPCPTPPGKPAPAGTGKPFRTALNLRPAFETAAYFQHHPDSAPRRLSVAEQSRPVDDCHRRPFAADDPASFD